MRFVFAVPLWLWPFYAVAWVMFWTFIILLGFMLAVVYLAVLIIVWAVREAAEWYGGRARGVE